MHRAGHIVHVLSEQLIRDELSNLIRGLQRVVCRSYLPIVIVDSSLLNVRRLSDFFPDHELVD